MRYNPHKHRLFPYKSGGHLAIFRQAYLYFTDVNSQNTIKMGFLTFSTVLSTPRLLKPIRLIDLQHPPDEKRRGLSLPGCGRGVTVPISVGEPNPIAPNDAPPSYPDPRQPAPVDFKGSPIQVTGFVCVLSGATRLPAAYL